MSEAASPTSAALISIADTLRRSPGPCSRAQKSALITLGVCSITLSGPRATPSVSGLLTSTFATRSAPSKIPAAGTGNSQLPGSWLNLYSRTAHAYRGLRSIRAGGHHVARTIVEGGIGVGGIAFLSGDLSHRDVSTAASE